MRVYVCVMSDRNRELRVFNPFIIPVERTIILSSCPTKNNKRCPECEAFTNFFFINFDIMAALIVDFLNASQKFIDAVAMGGVAWSILSTRADQQYFDASVSYFEVNNNYHLH